MSKITKATFKSFIKKNEGKLFVQFESRFDGMSDMVEYHREIKFEPAEKTTDCLSHNFGINGLWIVGQSRDYFTHFEDAEYIGIHYYNCCGSATIAIRKEIPALKYA